MSYLNMFSPAHRTQNAYQLGQAHPGADCDDPGPGFVQGLVLEAIARQCGLDPLASLRGKTREGTHAQDAVSGQAGSAVMTTMSLSLHE